MASIVRILTKETIDMGMFKKVGHGLAWAYKPAVNVKAWMGWDIIKVSSRYVYNLGKGLFMPQKAEYAETFEAALTRLNLSAADLQLRQKEFMHLFLVYGAIGLAIVIYSLYLFYMMNFMGGLLAIVVASLAFALAFRFHFWIFQIKHKKLGCSMREWWHSKIEDTVETKDGEDKS
jgi:intracellular multiplication protein IcmV